MIAEPTLEHYVYYLRQIAGDSQQAIEKRRAVFEQELDALLAHQARLSGQPAPAWEWPQPGEGRRLSQRIVGTGWLDNSTTGRSYFVEAQIYGDVYWLQAGYYQTGRVGPEIFARLRDEAWQPSATDNQLQNSTYLCGIVADEEMDKIAAQVLKGYTHHRPDVPLSTYLTECRTRLYGLRAQPHITTLLYPSEECEDWAGQNILNNVAPRLELYKHKVDRQLDWCERNHATLSEQKERLRARLDESTLASATDLTLLRQLVQLYRVFNGNVGMMAERQATIGINLENLDVVLKELGPLAQDRLLVVMRDHLRRRQKQLEADLTFADRLRQEADGTINALRVQLGLDHLLDFWVEPDEAGLISKSGFPGALSRPELKMPPPQINAPPHISLTFQDKTLLQGVFWGASQVLVEKEFGGGYGGARVLLTLPIRAKFRAARKVTKLGAALELRRERDNYEQYVKPFLPFCAAGVERDEYHEQGSQAGLNYYFVGGGALGQVMDLEQYYRQHSAEQVIKTLNDLLGRELGQRWHELVTPRTCFFAAEYGRHIVEHLRLKLHASWKEGESPATPAGYQQMDLNAIPREYEKVQPGVLLSIEGLVVTRVRHGKVKLEDPDGQGTVVRVEFEPGSDAAPALELGSHVGVRGQVIHNRRGRLEQITRAIFPDLLPGIDAQCIELPGVAGTYPNPLQVYPEILGWTLTGRESYVHGDLHLRNILVDEWGKGWLIDFAQVTRRHVLFDFIKLETYVRLMNLAEEAASFSLEDYAYFEKALNDATLGKESETPPNHPHLLHAYHVILAIRRIARNCMARESDFVNEYFPGLFLYCLAMTKYYQEDAPIPTRLTFVTASVLGQYLPEIEDWPCSPAPAQHVTASALPATKSDGAPVGPQPTYGVGNRWAVLVGVDEYEDKTNYGDLKVCVEDAGAICEQLVAGGFESGRIRLLSDYTPEPPTRANILTALKAVVDATEPDDLLLFYYSGHGDEFGGESYMVARDGRRLVLDDTAISISRVKEVMETALARAKVIILDACHSGADVGGKGPRPMSPEFIRRVFEEAEGLAILASCKQGQLSYEWRAQARSVFTHFLLQALSGQADRDDKGFVTVQDASRHVTDGVKLWASQNNTSQTPTLHYTVAGDIILVRYT